MQSLFEALTSADVRSRLARFFLVSVLNNMALLGLFAGLNALSIPQAVSLGVVYATAIGIGFMGNSRFAFRAGRTDWMQIARYIATYAVVFSLNLWLLSFLPRLLGVRSELVQFGLIFALGAPTFLALHWFVFPRVSGGGR